MAIHRRGSGSLSCSTALNENSAHMIRFAMRIAPSPISDPPPACHACSRLLRVAALVLLALPLASTACNREPERRWPPGVQYVPEHSPVLTPDAARDTFFLPPGYRLELVASEPLIADPVWIDVDPNGRLWVVEMRGFMTDNEGKGERAPVGRVVVLDDDDEDGRMDRSTVFIDGLVLPRSVKVLERGVLIAA